MNNASMLSNGSLKNYEECSIEVDEEDNTSFDEPSPKKIKVEENEFDEEDLTIDELWVHAKSNNFLTILF